MPAIQSPACRGRVDPQQGLHRSHPPVGAESKNHPSIQQRAERVGRARTIRTDALLRPSAVVYAVVGLHGSDDVQLRKARDVGSKQMLRVLDSQPTVASAFITLEPFKQSEDGVVRAISNRVDGNLDARSVGGSKLPVHPFRVRQLVAWNTLSIGRIVVRIKKPGGSRTERAICKALDSTDLQ